MPRAAIAGTSDGNANSGPNPRARDYCGSGKRAKIASAVAAKPGNANAAFAMSNPSA